MSVGFVISLCSVILTIAYFFIAFQPIAVEVFSADGRNYLLAFQKGVRNKVYQRCWMQTQTWLLDGCCCCFIAFVFRVAHNS